MIVENFKNIERINKYDFFNELLVEIFQVDEKYLNRKVFSDNIKLQVNLQESSKFLKDRWLELLKNSLEFDEIQKNYIEEYLPWKKKYEAFQNAINNSNISDFIQDYYSTWKRLKFESKQISIDEIRRLIEIGKPNLKRFYKSQFWGYHNFKIFESNEFQVFLHLRLKKNKTETFSLEIVFSFWFKNKENFIPLNLRFITSSYANQMIAYNIMKKLKSVGYIEDSLIYKEEKKSMFYTTIREEVKPHPSTCAILKILNDNPIALFNEIIQHLYDVDEIIREIIDKNEYNPQSYYNSLPTEIKKFLAKGKELVSKFEDFFTKETFTKKKTEEKIKSIETDDKLEEIIGIFKESLEKDKKNKHIEPEDKGFRTLNEILSNYGSILKYSHPVYYKYFDDNDLSLYFDERKKSGPGGGTQYRYKEFITATPKIIVPEKEEKEEKITFINEKIKIQEALYNYNNKDYENSIRIFEKILKKPSNQLISSQDLYLACLYYLGRSYFKLQNYKKALQSFNRISMFNKNLINVNFNLVECNRFLGNYNDAAIVLNEVILKIQGLLNKYFPVLELDKIFQRRFREFDLKTLHPDLLRKDILSDLLIFYNKDTSNIFIDVFREQNEEQKVNLSKNIVAVRSLYKILYKSLFLKMELSRRLIFQSLIENKEESLTTNINQLIEQIQSFKLIPNFKKNYNIQFGGFLQYLLNLLKVFNKHAIHERIIQQTGIPESFYFNLGFSRLKNYFPIMSFLNYYNDSLIRFNEIKKRLLYDDEFGSNYENFRQGEPVLKAEYLFTQAYVNCKYIIKNMIKEQSEEKLIDIQDLHDYYSFYPRSRNPMLYMDISEKAFNFCKENGFKILERICYKILKDAKEKYQIFMNLFQKRRILSINHYFKELYKNYETKEIDIELNYEKEPEESNIDWFVHDKIINKISRMLRKELNNLKITIKMFSAEILGDLIEAIKKNHHFLRQNLYRIEYFFDIDLNFNKLPLEKTLIIEMKFIINLDNENYFFFGNLDRITMGIFKILEYGIDDFKIKTKLDELEKYEMYFKNQFQLDFENKYFKFNIQKSPQKGIYNVKIQMIPNIE